MWIFLGILAFLAIVITAALLLPVYVIIKADRTEGICVRFKILGKLYGDEAAPDNLLVKTLKNASGISRLERNKEKKEQKTDLVDAVKDNLTTVTGLLKEVVGLLRVAKAKVFKVKIVCADECAATAALNYGRCCAIAAPALGYLHSILRIQPRGREVDIRCDYEAEKSSFYFETVLSIRIHRILAALLRTIMAETKRKAK